VILNKEADLTVFALTPHCMQHGSILQFIHTKKIIAILIYHYNLQAHSKPESPEHLFTS